MQNSMISIQILDKINIARLQECAYHKIQQNSDQNYGKVLYIVNSYFQCTFGLAIFSYSPFSFTFGNYFK